MRRRRRRRRVCAQARVVLAAPTRPNQTWTMDFLHDALAGGRRFRTLSIEDAYTREMPVIEVDTSLPALRVVRVLEKLRLERGLPERIVIDNVLTRERKVQEKRRSLSIPYGMCLTTNVPPSGFHGQGLSVRP